ncbi:uncharacterized protein LOC134202453 [Armigeres subalbatus]|uniref:uncharacterized protein LOC134202453 n=1 Tax=Armigeres subalbatus TaxID=124917 RepID=UPI002ED60E27
MSEDIICVSCKKEEKDSKKVIECVQCHKCEHFKCRNIFGSAVRKLKEKDFFCSADCQDLFQRASRTPAADSEISRELHALLLEVKATRSEVHDMHNTITEMEKFQDFLSQKLDTLLSEVQSLKTDQATMKAEADIMRKKHHDLCCTVNELEMEVERLNRMNLSKNMIVLGIPTKKDENIKQIIGKVSSAIGYDLPEEAILEAKRLSSSDAKLRTTESIPIKVVFVAERYKEELLAKKRIFGPLLSAAVDTVLSDGQRKVVLRDELTPRSMELYKQVREIQDSLNFKYVWPGRNGIILAKKTEKSKTEFIRTRHELLGLQRSGAKRNLDTSSSNCGIQTSPVLEPAAKRR